MRQTPNKSQRKIQMCQFLTLNVQDFIYLSGSVHVYPKKKSQKIRIHHHKCINGTLDFKTLLFSVFLCCLNSLQLDIFCPLWVIYLWFLLACAQFRGQLLFSHVFNHKTFCGIIQFLHQTSSNIQLESSKSPSKTHNIFYDFETAELAVWNPNCQLSCCPVAAEGYGTSHPWIQICWIQTYDGTKFTFMVLCISSYHQCAAKMLILW